MPRRSRDPAETLAAELRDGHILVVCGSGGVGKTTAAAALGLRASLQGRRVLVCTIDPSRRLATSLGLAQLSGKPRALDLRRFDVARGGALFAMTLDTKSTFDALVERHAPNEAAKKRILENRFYREISAALAGSHEYMAMEKLLDLSADERFDLVVLDTPPTRHALDFLEAPDRLMSFLDTSILRFFLKPYFFAGRLTIKVATQAGAIALKLVDRLLGLDFLRDLSEFFLAFEAMYDGFKERAGKVHALLRDPHSAFLLVAMVAAAMSSLDSVLLVTAATTERDIVGVFRPGRDEAAELRATRLWVGVFAAVTATVALEPPGGIVRLTAFSGSLYGACFFPAILFGLYWRRGGGAAVLASFAAGLLVLFGWRYVPFAELLHEVFPALALSTAAYVVVALRTPPVDSEVVRGFFAGESGRVEEAARPGAADRVPGGVSRSPR